MSELMVTDLPDYPALADLAFSLWSDDVARGTAVLVGAGFSRNAQPAGHVTGRPPIWTNLSPEVTQILYRKRLEKTPKISPRLAEEFKTYPDQAAFTEFLLDYVPDVTLRPGPLHIDLMALPWADVLTTNYDTFLERAADRHEVVRDIVALAQVRGPRVIKLHGSLDGDSRLVMTEEDHRTYPIHSAAFVNTARQVFRENELCFLVV
jgi:hypothetical protein